MAAPVPRLDDRRRHLRLVTDPPDSALPRTRGECENGARPCPLVSCRFHLAVDVTFAGTLRVKWDPSDDDRPSCSLDAADLGGLGSVEVATLMGLTRQQVDHIEERAKRKIRKRMRRASE